MHFGHAVCADVILCFRLSVTALQAWPAAGHLFVPSHRTTTRTNPQVGVEVSRP